MLFTVFFVLNLSPSLVSVLFAVSWRSSRIPWLFLNVIPLGRLCLDLQEQNESSLDEIDMFGEEGCKRSDVHDDVDDVDDDVSQYLYYIVFST